MKKYYYYFYESNEDLLYEMPMYFAAGVEMSTTTFNLMFGRPTLGKQSTIKLERIDDEDLKNMKRFGSFKEGLVRIAYPNVLNDLIMNNDYYIDENDCFYVP